MADNVVVNQKLHCIACCSQFASFSENNSFIVATVYHHSD